MKSMNVLLALLLTCILSAPATLCFAATAKTDQAVSAVVEKININTAGVAELTKLPGVGEKRAGDIVAFREQNGKFASFEDLLGVKGIGEKSLEKMIPHMTL